MKFLERALEGPNQWWRYLLVLILTILGTQIIGSIPIIIVMVIKIVTEGGAVDLSQFNGMNFEALGISKNLGLFLMMIPFVVLLFMTIICIKVFHQRTFSETVNGTKKIRFGRCLEGAVVWGIMLALYFFGDYLINQADYIFQFNCWNFVPLLLISVLLIPIQTTAEELLFRGYLAQGVGIWTRNRWLAILIPAVLFGLMHYANPEVKEFGFWIAMPQYILFGLIFGFVAIMDDGIELAMGMHAVNNVFLSLMVTHSASALQTDAVFSQMTVNPVKEALSLLIIGIVVLVYFSLKYKWSLKTLNVKVEKSTEE